MNDMEELDEVMARAILEAWGPKCSHCSPDYPVFCGCARNAAKAAVSAMLSHIKAAGWQLVPKVATDTMTQAALKARVFGESAETRGRLATYTHGQYSSMLAAAPKFGEEP